VVPSPSRSTATTLTDLLYRTTTFGGGEPSPRLVSASSIGLVEVAGGGQVSGGCSGLVADSQGLGGALVDGFLHVRASGLVHVLTEQMHLPVLAYLEDILGDRFTQAMTAAFAIVDVDSH
jgi:hypothetical protein